MLMERFVKLNELEGFDEEFKNALGELEQRIFESYSNTFPKETGDSTRDSIRENMFRDFCDGLGYDSGGRKYLRVVSGAFGTDTQTTVWGFIAKQDFKVKSKRKTGPEFVEFKEGDLLKSAGWKTPALNAPRGNIFDESYQIAWTGPQYL